MKNKKLILIITIVGVVVLGVGLVFLWKRVLVQPEILPELPVVEISPPVPQPLVSNYSLWASLPRIEKIPVYQYERATTRGRPYENWARSLGFGGLPQKIKDARRGALYLWSKEGETLVIDEGASSLSYRVDLHADPNTLVGSFLPTFEEASLIVERTLTELGDESGLLEFNPTKNKALGAGVSLVQETTLAEAELLEIHFTAKVGNYPLYLESGPELDPVIAWVGKDGKLLRLDYHPVGTLGEKIADYPLKNKEEILRSLDRGEGVVVSSSLRGGEEMAATVITKVGLGYLLPQPEATVIQPIYILQGQVMSKDGKTARATIYLSAIGEINPKF